MPCQGCINRQRKLVEKLCAKRPDGLLCRKARSRLERMTAPKPEETKHGSEKGV
jgi:hypothetical protein